MTSDILMFSNAHLPNNNTSPFNQATEHWSTSWFHLIRHEELTFECWVIVLYLIFIYLYFLLTLHCNYAAACGTGLNTVFCSIFIFASSVAFFKLSFFIITHYYSQLSNKLLEPKYNLSMNRQKNRKCLVNHKPIMIRWCIYWWCESSEELMIDRCQKWKMCSSSPSPRLGGGWKQNIFYMEGGSEN